MRVKMRAVITCTFEDGNSAALRHVTVDAIVVSEGKLLLVKRALHLVEGGKYCLPGGYLDREETMFEAVRREVHEETGYDCEPLQALRVSSNPRRRGDDRQNVTVIFVATVGELTGQPDNEVLAVEWFPLGTLPPEELIAFDHAENIALYRRWQADEIELPLFD